MAGLAFGSSVQASIGERGQTIHSQPGFNDDAGTVATIATIGAAARNEFLTSKTRTAVSPFASVQFNFDSIDEHTLNNSDLRRWSW